MENNLNTLLFRAAVHAASGRPMPTDLWVALTNHGIDVPALETKLAQ